MGKDMKIKGALAVTFLSAATAFQPLQANDDISPLPDAHDPATHHSMTTSYAFNQGQIDYISDIIDLARSMHIDKDKAGNDDEIMAAAINGALKALDPHSAYLTPSDFQKMIDRANGSFAGIGATLELEAGELVVIDMVENAPAELGGLQAMDRITHINQHSVQDMTMSDALELVRGEVGTSLELTVIRSGQPAFNVNLTRDIIHTPTINSMMIGEDIAYIGINTFLSHDVDQDLYDAVNQLKATNTINGYVLDLRDNPGGYLHMANAISDAFIDSDETILTVKGREENDVQTFYATPGDITDGKDMVVLIDEGSASAAEVVAGALQDTQRATILGMQSYGKGSVQNIVPLQSGGALKITTARYYTAGGQSIQNYGITPDIAYIRNAEDHVPALKTESDQVNALSNPDRDAADLDRTRANCTAITTTPQVPYDNALETRSAKIDFALACAVETLRNQPSLTVTTPVRAPAPSV